MENIKIFVPSDTGFGEAATTAAFKYKQKNNLPRFSEIEVRFIGMTIVPDTEIITYSFNVYPKEQ